MRILISEAAEADLSDAVAWYESREPGVGLQFASEIGASLKLIGDYPRAWTEVHDGARRCQTNRFPYLIIYKIYSDHIFIVMIVHAKRRPSLWRQRLKHQPDPT
jgi:plasmid stabilization system protein ParE